MQLSFLRLVAVGRFFHCSGHRAAVPGNHAVPRSSRDPGGNHPPVLDRRRGGGGARPCGIRAWPERDAHQRRH